MVMLNQITDELRRSSFKESLKDRDSYSNGVIKAPIILQGNFVIPAPVKQQGNVIGIRYGSYDFFRFIDRVIGYVTKVLSIDFLLE